MDYPLLSLDHDSLNCVVYIRNFQTVSHKPKKGVNYIYEGLRKI